MPVRPFETLMVIEGRWTGDERFFNPECFSWDGLLPINLTVDHAGTTDSIIGRIDTIERRPGPAEGEHLIVGQGLLDLGVEGTERAERMADIVRQIEDGFLRGVSIEFDSTRAGEPPPDTWAMVVETARLRAASVVQLPAFPEAYITLGAVDPDTVANIPAVAAPEPIEMDEDVIIMASGHTITIPDVPPAEWFVEPTDVEMAGALTVTDEGRVYGLLAPAGVGHVGRADRIHAPMGNVDYSRFMRTETVTEGGGRVPTGNLTMNCGHGDPNARASAVVEHYDNSCSLVASVSIGECAEGVWVAGALLPGVTADQVRRMMSLSLSGHWLPTTDGYELLGALLVPVPGYPMARRRASVTVRDGRLVASAVPVIMAGGHTDCGCDSDDLADRLARVEAAMAPIVLLSLDRRFEELTAASA